MSSTCNLLLGLKEETTLRRGKVNGSDVNYETTPAYTPEAREAQLIALAVDRAEQQLRDGTASSQVITHYLKLAGSRDRLEREKLEEENKLLRARTEAIKSEKRNEELFQKVIDAMRRYSGNDDEDDQELY